MTFEDDLQRDLRAAGDTIPVAGPGVAAIERRARRRTARQRAAAGFGAVALLAGAFGGTYALTRGDGDTVDVATGPSGAEDRGADGDAAIASQEASSDDAALSRIPVAPGEVNLGEVPLTWEVLESNEAVQLYDARIDGDLVYARHRDGWLAVSSDLVEWRRLAVPAELVDPDRLHRLGGWVNAFDVSDGVIVAAVEIFDDTDLLDEEEALARAEEAGEDGVPEPFVEPCRSRSSNRSVVYRSADGGTTWTATPMPDDRPEGRFHGGTAVPWVAVGGGAALLASDGYLSLDVECVLHEAGIDIRQIHRDGGGYGWDDQGVQIYGFDEEAQEERPVQTHPWAELNLTEAELRSVTSDLERGGMRSSMFRLDEAGALTRLDLTTAELGALIAVDGEFVVTRWGGNAQELLRSADRGDTWTPEPFEGFIRSVRGDLLYRETFDGSPAISVSADGGRTWSDLGAPPGTWVQDVAILADVALAVGEGNFGDVAEPGVVEEIPGPVPLEQRASVGGYDITVVAGDLGVEVTVVDERTGEIVSSGLIPSDDVTDVPVDVGFMRIDEDGVVTFVGPDGVDVVSFTGEELDAAFDQGGSSGRAVVEPATPVPTPAEEPATQEPATEESGAAVEVPAEPEVLVACEEDDACEGIAIDSGEGPFRPDSFISYRDAAGSWISQPVSEIVGTARFAEAVFVLGGVFHVVLAPDYEALESEEPPAGATAEERAAFDEARAFPASTILVGRPRT